MERYTITIAREFGSLGRAVAQRLAGKLGIEYYDRDIVDQVAQQLNLPLSQISSAEERSHHGFIFDVQKDIILELAKKSSCIIVGRCSDFLLKNEKNVMNVFIYAPYEARLENCVKQLGMTQEEARRMIASVDKARNAYHRKYAGYLPSDTSHKHLLLDSSLLGVDETAEVLAEVVRKRFF